MACYSKYFFTAPPPDEAPPPCSSVPAAPPVGSASVRVQLFLGPDVSEGDAALETHALASYYQRYGISFSADSPPVSTEMMYAISATKADIDNVKNIASSSATKGSVETNEEQIRRAIVQILLAPIQHFISDQSNAKITTLQIVILSRMTNDYVEDTFFPGEHVAGLGISPALIHELQQTNSKDLRTYISLPESFAPVVFISHSVLTAFGGANSVVSHEVGHCFGLVHVEDPANLMFPEAPLSCTPYLDEAQLAQISATIPFVRLRPNHLDTKSLEWRGWMATGNTSTGGSLSLIRSTRR